MSTTTTTTAEQQTPQITVITRVASIPLISSGLGTIDGVLAHNPYLASPYATAKELSTSAYKFSEPIQVKLAPLIVRADGIANAAVDAVESRYPYPFKAQPEEVATYVRERRESTTNYVHERVNNVNKTIDDKVKSPALAVVADIDQRLTPIVDFFEAKVPGTHYHAADAPSSPEAKYQYQRALVLSKNVLYSSGDYLRDVQAQNVYAQKAAEAVNTFTAAASSSLASAQTRVHGLSDAVIGELTKLQASTAQLATSIQSSVQGQLPQVQKSYEEVSTALVSTIQDLKDIIAQQDVPVNEKVSRLSQELTSRVSPLLETIKKNVSDVLAGTKEVAKENGEKANGNGHAH